MASHVPSYPDRICSRVNNRAEKSPSNNCVNALQTSNYTFIDICGSDHKPVYADFDVQLAEEEWLDGK